MTNDHLAESETGFFPPFFNKHMGGEHTELQKSTNSLKVYKYFKPNIFQATVINY